MSGPTYVSHPALWEQFVTHMEVRTLFRQYREHVKKVVVS